MKAKYYNELPADFDFDLLMPAGGYSQAVLELVGFLRSGKKYCLFTFDDAKAAKSARATIYAYMKRNGIRQKYRAVLRGENLLIITKDNEESA